MVSTPSQKCLAEAAQIHSPKTVCGVENHSEGDTRFLGDSCYLLEDLEGLGNLAGVYVGEPALGASPAPDGEVFALEDDAGFCQEVAEDASWVRGSSLNHAPLFRIHWHASAT